MLRAAMWSAVLTSVLLVVSGDSVKTPSLVDEFNPQLKESILQTVLEVPPLHNNCTDHHDASSCEAVVENGLCTGEEFYARFCCRSCTLAWQIPTYGPHLRQTAKVKITVAANSQYTVSGNDFTISCEASSFPVPDVFWYFDEKRIILGESYEQEDEIFGGILIKTKHSKLTVKNFTLPSAIFTCLAVKEGERVSKDVVLRVDDEFEKILPEYPLYALGEEMTLKCASRGRDLEALVWLTTKQSIPVGDRHRIIDNSTTEEGVTTLRSSLTVQFNESGCHFYECQAVYKDGHKVAVDSKSVRVEDVSPDCIDVGDSLECYQNRQLCHSHANLMAAYCCKTCAFIYYRHAEPVNIKDMLNVSIRSMSNKRYGESVTLECSSDSLPGNQSVTWHFGNTTIQNTYHYNIREVRQCDHIFCEVKSFLTLHRVNVGDLGQYVCRATNGIVGKEASRFLTLSRNGDIFLEPEDNTENNPPTRDEYMRYYGEFCYYAYLPWG